MLAVEGGEGEERAGGEGKEAAMTVLGYKCSRRSKYIIVNVGYYFSDNKSHPRGRKGARDGMCCVCAPLKRKRRRTLD